MNYSEMHCMYDLLTTIIAIIYSDDPVKQHYRFILLIHKNLYLNININFEFNGSIPQSNNTCSERKLLKN